MADDVGCCQPSLIFAAHTCRHRELAGVQIEQRAEGGIIKWQGRGHVHIIQEGGQRQHIEAITPARESTTLSYLA